MIEFIVYPAIDLRFGNVVRLLQGKAEKQTIYSRDPKAVAESWLEQGAQWLHIVNLNSAFGEDSRENEKALLEILSVGHGTLNIQLGGGFRSISHIDRALSMGVSRVILGTSVIENPGFGVEALEGFGGEKIVFALDAINDELMTEGWQNPSGISMVSLANILVDSGARTLIYTNILKDGMQTGVDWESAKILADNTGVSIIASGGVATLSDIAKVRSAGLDGVIVGRALYEGIFTLEEAIDVG
jgi:phosphoribosylformimino-5-aminoimidazole carboxamide ribotide isomerase